MGFLDFSNKWEDNPPVPQPMDDEPSEPMDDEDGDE